MSREKPQKTVVVQRDVSHSVVCRIRIGAHQNRLLVCDFDAGVLGRRVEEVEFENTSVA